ncbi:MAG: DUF1565 domain-containing protein [Methanobrevibacter sp.]|jgi:pectin methylesterase-like acyl-CoA thioesterase|nr:DUF1565 domain-containing protein [Candidatus Methanovirga meridionalis]
MFNNKKTLFSAIMIIAILLSVSTVIAANDNDTVYVSPTGNDANTGTIDSPLNSIAKAVEIAPNGGTVFIKAGTYLGSEGNRGIRIDKNITIKGEDKATTIIDGSTGVSEQIFDISLWHDHITKVTIQGLTFKNFANGYQTVRVNDGDVTIEDSDFINNYGVALFTFSENTTIRNCNFIGNNNSFFGAAINGAGGFTILNSTFINNTASQRSAAIDLAAGSPNRIVRDCTFSGNEAPTYNDIFVGVGILHIYNSIFDPVTIDSNGNSKPSIGKGASSSNQIFVNDIEI